MELSQNQYEVLARLNACDGPVLLPELAAALKVDQSLVTAACAELEDHGYVWVDESESNEYALGDAGKPFVDALLPERIIVGVLRDQGGSCKLTDVPKHCDLDASQVGQSLRWLNQRGWAKKAGDTLVLAASNVPDDRTPDEKMIAALTDGRIARWEELTGEGIDVAAAHTLLTKRKGFLVVKLRTDRRVSLTKTGRELLAAGAKGRKRVTQLTPEMLSDGSWREMDIAPYDVTLAAKKLYPGKEHPYQRTIDKVRRVFLEMGFSEVVSPWIESSFWDFDALFQPQDHPARDMQDTFYIAKPASSKLPDDALVDRIRATHEDGGDTGSTGWRYRWNREMAHRPVLRTHTTAATIRALAAHAAQNRDRKGAVDVGTWEGGKVGTEEGRSGASRSHVPTFPRSPDRPGKYFSVGPVFRRETVDFKHLPMFYQVDGIIVDKSASLATLLGTLAAFYKKMGFPKIRFRPSFFPYTEPSAEVFLWFESRQEWIEMGGSGIFRPEVTRPVGITDRVLAWGLGLERLAMMIHGLKTIGQLYFADMPWLRETPLCRS